YVRHKRNPGDITSKQIRQALKKSESRTDADGETLFSPRAAARYADVDTQTLLRWHREACPWLGGKCLIVRKLPDGLGKLTRYYLKRELDQLLAGRAARPATGQIGDDAKWLPLRKAAALLGRSVQLLCGWIASGCPHLGGAKLKHEKRPGRRK